MTIDEVQSLIANGVVESQDLEYKAAAAIANKDEITKDITAFANASGGRIIYGVAQFQDKLKRHLPERLDLIKGTEYSAEYLDQVINSIQQRIVSHKIDSLEVEPGLFVYVVDIKPSDTAHQAGDKRYYRRYNLECQPMFDYEIRDIMNRSKQPKVVCNIAFELKDGRPKFVTPQLTNVSKVIAINVHSVITVPSRFLDARFSSGKPVKRHGSIEFEFRDFESESTHIHPGRTVDLQTIWLDDDDFGRALLANSPLYFESSPIEWTVYADSAEVQRGEINLRDAWRSRLIAKEGLRS